MRWSELKKAGHFPTLVSAFLYFDYSFMVWTLLGVLGAQIAAPESLNLTHQQKGLMVATPILAGAILRILLGLMVDRIGAKRTGILAQCVVIAGLAFAWLVGLHNFSATLLMGCVLGFAGASFAVALPQRFAKDLGLMTGLVGCGGGIGGFVLATLLGFSRQHTGSYLTGLLMFGGMCFVALIGLTFVKRRWRTTWGALVQARI